MTTKLSVSVNSLLLDVRLCFYVIAFLHLIFVAAVTLSIDTSADEDVRVKAYMNLRWKLLTSWYNLISLAYLPFCVYESYKQRKGLGHAPHVLRIRRLIDVVMTSFLFPITLYGGILFWSLNTIDPSLIGPAKVFSYLPDWCQHSLHTVPVVMVFLDLLLTPRSKPKSLVPRFLLATTFAAIYTLMVYISHRNDEIIYPIFGRIGVLNTILFTILSYILYTSLYFLQWKIIGFVCRPEALKHNVKNKFKRV